jgi:hypothetical protein
MSETLYTGQGVAKDCIVGDRFMNRYGIFNGLELPRKIDYNQNVSLLGFQLPTINSIVAGAGGGSLSNGGWYAYRAVYASSKHVRPVAVLDGSGTYTRGNGSDIMSAQATATQTLDVEVTGTTDAAVTHVMLYRSLGASTQAGAESGPFYYVTKEPVTNPTTLISDTTSDASVGQVLETDNFAPNAYRCAVAAYGYIFAGGNFPLGEGHTCTVTPGSSTVTISEGILYDGVKDWYFKCNGDNEGGIDGGGLYFARYVDSNTLQLVDVNGDALNYDGTLSGAGQEFTTYISGYSLRWCKYGEPEAWPTLNNINFEGDIMGIAVMPNLPLLVVCTDTPSIWILDLTQVGTYNFKTNKRLISTTYTASSHYSLEPVDTKLRGIDASLGCIWETDGVSVVDITRNSIPNIFKYLDNNIYKVRNWHCAYDYKNKIFGAFVSYKNSFRAVDFCLGQNVITGSWFFNWEKDLLCTGHYVDPETQDHMILGGTQGSDGTGAVWGRIWAPGVYDDWVPSGSLRSGLIVSATATELVVDNTDLDLWTDGSGMLGRWVLVCDANGENTQVAYIDSNTANTITINDVVGGVLSNEFSPVPEEGWRFYIGVIEMRWGPKRFDFGDPDNDKSVREIMVVMEDYDEDDLPLVRLYRGLESGYAVQRELTPSHYRDGETQNNTLFSRYEHHIEPTKRWGLALVDRSYDATTLHSVTVVFHRCGGANERK